MKETGQRGMVVGSVACCGLVCALDSCSENCDGCRAGMGCGDRDCFQKECCATKGYYGCWECLDFPCGEGYFADSHLSRGQFVGCVRYIKEFGVERYVAAIVRNQDKGLRYGLNGAYGDKSEAEVLNLLETA
jgi:hypothetical protein